MFASFFLGWKISTIAVSILCLIVLLYSLGLHLFLCKNHSRRRRRHRGPQYHDENPNPINEPYYQEIPLQVM